MRSSIPIFAVLTFGAVFISSSVNTAPNSQPSTPSEKVKIEKIISDLGKDMASKCPISGAGDQAAFDVCRNALYNDSPMRQLLSTRTLWGRTPANPETRLKDYGSTQFASEVLAGMYLPLFMYTGQSKVEFNETEGLYKAELGVAFRNQMQPGEFPYPFWHEENKWSQYQGAKTVILWINPETVKIVSGQFTPKGSMGADLGTAKVDHKFEGTWTWTDADGKQQPKLTLFEGMFSPSNPYMAKLDVTYKEFAMSLREGQCMSCHVPNNPDKMKKLVLMQTPRHAAAEIGRIVDDVKRDKMPLTKWGVEEALPQSVKDIFLTRGENFASAVASAKDWEKTNAKGFTGGVIKQ